MNITEIKAHDLHTYKLAVALDKAERDASYKLDRIHDAAGDKRVNVSKRYGYSDFRWQLSDDEAIAKVQAVVADPKGTYPYDTDADDNFFAYIGREAQGKLDAYNEAAQEVHELGVQIGNNEAVFRANGWSRFEAVPGGHIHDKNRRCHTLRPGKTLISWVYSLSGDTEADAVKQYGPALCSHCFKSAPVEWQQQAKVQQKTNSQGEKEVITLAEAQAIADEKAAKKAAKEAKAAARAAKRG